MTGRTGYGENILMVKTDPDGNMEWSRYLSRKDHILSSYSMKKAEEGSILITGYTETGPPYSFHPFVIKLSARGNIHWSREYFQHAGNFSTINDVEFTPQGYLFHSYNAGYTVIFETDTSGIILWNTLYDLPTNYLIEGTVPRIIKTYDQAFVFINQNDYWLNHVVKIDTTGAVLWAREMMIDPVDIFETESSEYFVAGNRLEIAMPLEEARNSCVGSAGFIQIDSTGKGEDCVNEIIVGISETSLTEQTFSFSSSPAGGSQNTPNLEIHSEITYNIEEGCAFDESGGSVDIQPEDLIRIYPNPTTGILNLELETINYGRIILMNYLGQIIYEAFLHEWKTVIDLNTLPDGIYLYRIDFGDNSFIHGKIAICK
jgi:hypothetical protein